MMDAKTELEFIDIMTNYLQNVAIMDRSEAKNIAKDIYYTYIEEEKISFGDDGYSWDEQGAIDIVKADIEYWED